VFNNDGDIPAAPQNTELRQEFLRLMIAILPQFCKQKFCALPLRNIRQASV